MYGSWNRRSCGCIGCSDASAIRIVLPVHTSRRVSPGGTKLSRFGTCSFECVCCGWRDCRNGAIGAIVAVVGVGQSSQWRNRRSTTSGASTATPLWRNHIIFMILTVITSYAGVCRKIPCHLLFSADWLRDQLIVVFSCE